MNKLFRYSLIVYRLLLILAIPLFFIGKFMAGFAGYNTPLEIRDYIFIVYSILTAFLLTLFLQKENSIVRILLLIVITIALLFSFYGLYDLLFPFRTFTQNDFIPLTILLLFIGLIWIVWMGLLKNKTEKLYHQK